MLFRGLSTTVTNTTIQVWMNGSRRVEESLILRALATERKSLWRAPLLWRRIFEPTSSGACSPKKGNGLLSADTVVSQVTRTFDVSIHTIQLRSRH
jgi:hypothetical protein